MLCVLDNEEMKLLLKKVLMTLGAWEEIISSVLAYVTWSV